MRTDYNTFSPYVRHVRTTPLRGVTPAYVDPDYVFTYIQDGAGVFLLDHLKYFVNKGDVVVIAPYIRHVITPVDTLNQYVIHFDLHYQSKRRGRIDPVAGAESGKVRGGRHSQANALAAFPQVLSLNGRAGRQIEEHFKALKKIHENTGPVSELRSKSLMLEILCIYFASLQKKPPAIRHPKAWRNIERAIRYIDDSYMHPIDLNEVSRSVGLSPNYFCTMFKQCTHSTPHRYLNAVRVQRAKILMENGDLNFTEIAEEVGFSSIYVFSRVFKRLEGCSPSEYLSEQLT